MRTVSERPLSLCVTLTVNPPLTAWKGRSANAALSGELIAVVRSALGIVRSELVEVSPGVGMPVEWSLLTSKMS